MLIRIKAAAQARILYFADKIRTAKQARILDFADNQKFKRCRKCEDKTTIQHSCDKYFINLKQFTRDGGNYSSLPEQEIYIKEKTYKERNIEINNKHHKAGWEEVLRGDLA